MRREILLRLNFIISHWIAPASDQDHNVDILTGSPTISQGIHTSYWAIYWIHTVPADYDEVVMVLCYPQTSQLGSAESPAAMDRHMLGHEKRSTSRIGRLKNLRGRLLFNIDILRLCAVQYLEEIPHASSHTCVHICLCTLDVVM
jgi:hypothetical protein